MKLCKKVLTSVLIISALLLALYHLNHKDTQWISVNNYVGIMYNRSNKNVKTNLNNEVETLLLDEREPDSFMMQTKVLPDLITNGTRFNTQKNLTIAKNDLARHLNTQGDKTLINSRKGSFKDREANGENIMKVFEYRKQLLRKMCQQFRIHENGTLSSQDSTDEKYIDKELEDPVEFVLLSNFHLVRSASSMTCLINKVASTSLAVSLLKADGRSIPQWNEDISPHNTITVLKPKTQAEFNFARKHFFKFLLVRDPFERLLSAYRDKIEKANHWSLKKLRKHIFETVKEIHDLRKQMVENDMRLNDEMDPVTVVNLTEYTRTSKTFGDIRNCSNNAEDFACQSVVLGELPDEGEEKETPLPTFGDFLEYILVSDEDGDFRSHWTPYWERCTPCSIQYDVIAKLETIDRDLTIVYERLGLLQKNRQPWYNRTVGSKSPMRDILHHYYSQLDPLLIGRIFRRYALDFHLFDYDIYEVFKVAGFCNTSSCEEVDIYL